MKDGKSEAMDTDCITSMDEGDSYLDVTSDSDYGPEVNNVSNEYNVTGVSPKQTHDIESV